MSGPAFLEHSLPEAISASLAGLRSLTVRSSLLAARLAEANPDPRHIAREADVDMLLAGTILCEGDQVRVSAELIHAPSGTLVGSYVCTTRLRQPDRGSGQPGARHRGIAGAALDRARAPGSGAQCAGFRESLRVLPARQPCAAPADLGEPVDGAGPVPRMPGRRPGLRSGVGAPGKVLSIPGEVRPGGTAEPGIGEVGISPRICAESRPAHRAQSLYADRGRFGARPGGHGAAPGASGENIPTIPNCSGAWFRPAVTAACWTNRSGRTTARGGSIRGS